MGSVGNTLTMEGLISYPTPNGASSDLENGAAPPTCPHTPLPLAPFSLRPLTVSGYVHSKTS